MDLLSWHHSFKAFLPKRKLSNWANWAMGFSTTHVARNSKKKGGGIHRHREGCGGIRFLFLSFFPT